MNINTENIDLNTFSHKQPYPLIKRVFDILILLILSPILILIINIICILIWIEDRNNPFFIQMRTGTYGKRFPMFKFRTMVPNADVLKKELMHLNELEYPDFKIQDDPRITKIGRFLRRTSLDELPQFFNVAMGDMSLVGPRPTSFPAETYEPWQRERLMVVPGVTGLWQVCGRSDIEFNERVELDIQYIEQQSFAYDLTILWRTVSSVLKCRGAY